jgi:hypothetical protein
MDKGLQLLCVVWAAVLHFEGINVKPDSDDKPEGRLLRIELAFPVREAVGSGAANDGINVEMDPEDHFKVWLFVKCVNYLPCDFLSA